MVQKVLDLVCISVAFVQVVSKDGSLISKSGIMTGGDASIFTSKLQRWQAADTDKLKEKYLSNAAELEVIHYSIMLAHALSLCAAVRQPPFTDPIACYYGQTSKGRVRTLDKEISNLRREKDDVDNKHKSAKTRKEIGEGLLKTRKAEIEKMTKQVQEKQKAVQEVEKVIELRNVPTLTPPKPIFLGGPVVSNLEHNTENEGFNLVGLAQRIKARTDQLDKEQQALSTINDKVFAAFCKENGISSITEYEGGSLAEVRERKQKLNKLSMQVFLSSCPRSRGRAAIWCLGARRRGGASPLRARTRETMIYKCVNFLSDTNLVGTGGEAEVEDY